MLLSICITTGGTIHSNTVSCLFDSLGSLPIDKYVGIMTGGYKVQSLYLAVEAAKRAEATHIMFIDNDMIFPPDGIKRLMDRDRSIVGAPYNERRMPLQSTVKLANAKGELVNGTIDQYTDIFPVYALGFGFLLVKMTVFDKLSMPYFNAPLAPDGEFMTEDFYFCDKAQKAGFQIWCDPTILCKHEGMYLY